MEKRNIDMKNKIEERNDCSSNALHYLVLISFTPIMLLVEYLDTTYYYVVAINSQIQFNLLIMLNI